MTHYRHLNQNERYQIQALVTAGVPTHSIAKQLARHVDTIKRELARGCQHGRAYCAVSAHELSQKRKTASRNARRIDDDCWALVWEHLSLGLSPQQVAGRLKAQEIARVSHECIYQKLYASAQLPAQLRCQRKKRRARATAKRSNSRRGVNSSAKCRFSHLKSVRPLARDRHSVLGDGWGGLTSTSTFGVNSGVAVLARGQKLSG